MGGVEGVLAAGRTRKPLTETARHRSKSRHGRSTEKKVNQGVLRYVPVSKKTEEAPKDLVPVEGSTDLSPPSQKDHQLELEELEEGEIYQQVIEVFNATQQEEAEVGELRVVVVVEQDGQQIIPSGVTRDLHQDEFGSGANGSQETTEEDNVEVLDIDKESTEARTSSHQDLELCTGSPVSPGDFVNTEQGTESNSFPPGEHECEKPFLLVNNRRSGRKAANRP